MKNSEMTKNRFAKLAKGRRIMARMVKAWDNNGFVRIGTATRYTDIKAKNRALVSLSETGSVFIQRGRQLECCDFCSFQFSA